jgi:hypothetical protein
MFLAEITTLSENAGPFYPCLIRLVNSAEHPVSRHDPRVCSSDDSLAKDNGMDAL